MSVEEAKSWFPSYSLVASIASSKSCGVAVLFKPSFSLLNTVSDSSGRFVRACLSRLMQFLIWCRFMHLIYGLPICPFFPRCSLSWTLVPPLSCVGTLILVMDPSRDRWNAGGQSVTDTPEVLASFFRDLSCVDAWPSCHPTQQAFTWLQTDGTCASRIDLVGCPVSWLPSVSTCDIFVCPVSDHSAVSLTLTSLPGAVSRGPGFWKLNTSILTEPDYIAEISSFWSTWQGSKDSSSSLLDWLDLGKARIESLSLDYCCRCSTRRKAKSIFLSAEVARLKSLVDLGHVSALPDYKKALSELQEFSLDQDHGAQLCSHTRWVEEGESSSAYFFHLERRRKAESTISSPKVGDCTVTSTEALLTAASDFYKNLYASCDTDPVVQDELLSNLSLSLSSEEADLYEGDLTVAECLKAVQGMAKSKTPGLDGLPAEFYLAFWSVLGSDLVDVLNCAFRVGFLSVSQRCGLINLVFKAEIDR